MANQSGIQWKRVGVEAVVIVTSILLALAADAWWEQVGDRREEVALIEALSVTLRDDLLRVRDARDTIQFVSDGLIELEDHFATGDLRSRSDQDQQAMRAFMRFTQIEIRYAPFETLKDRGLEALSNPSLRNAVTALYEEELPRLQSNAEIDRLLSRDRILPFKLEYFDLDTDGNWVLRGDEPEVRNRGGTLVRYRRRTLVRFFLPSFDHAIDRMNETLQLVDEELARAR